MIAAAQRGSERSAQEIVLRHIGFVSFRLHRRAFPDFLRRFGEELLSEAIPILYAKIQTYDLDYCDKSGQRKPVKFVSYIWKWIDGFIIDALKEELRNDRLGRRRDPPDGEHLGEAEPQTHAEGGGTVWCGAWLEAEAAALSRRRS